MAGTGKEGHLSFPSFPPLRLDQRSDTADSVYKSDRPSSIPIPVSVPGRAQSTTPVFAKPNHPSPSRPKSLGPTIHHRFLTPAEWARLAHGVGAIRDGDSETHAVIHPNCWYWPPKGMPEGLYRDVITESAKYFILYHLLSMLRWFLMILQIVLGAVLTALGSVHLENDISITILAALNTINAGLLALMHNSGLPDRYRMDRAEFIKVEDHLKEILDTGIIENGQTVDDVLSDCFSKFQDAKTTVRANKPDSYTIPPSTSKDRPIPCPDPPAHFFPVNHH